MKTQCPNCKSILAVPDEYKDENIVCTKCGKSFPALKFKKPPIVIPSALPSSGNFITRIWAKSPVAFRAGFLGTLGVIAALWLAWHIMGIGTRFQRATVPKTTSSISQVFLYDYDFEQKIDFHRPNNQPVCKLIWYAWLINPLAHSVDVDCFIEFQDPYGSVLTVIGPIQRKVYPTIKGKELRSEINGIYWMPDNIFRQVDLVKSRIWIEIKK